MIEFGNINGKLALRFLSGYGGFSGYTGKIGALNFIEEFEKYIIEYIENQNNMINIKIKPFNPDARWVIPYKAKNDNGNAAFDLFPSSWEIKDNKIFVDFNISTEFPSTHVALIFPRSSIHKLPYRLSNGVGVIDSNYRGSWRAVFDLKEPWNDEMTKDFWAIPVAQVIFMEIPEVQFEVVEELSSSNRGTDGFGSTNK